MKAENLPFADGEFDLASAIEVLEHVPDPEHTVAEMARVAQRWLLVSVPREPLWRALNMARGAYIKELGNTPGHLNHWSKRGFVALLARHGEVVEARSPFPWTMLLVRLRGWRRARAARARARLDGRDDDRVDAATRAARGSCRSASPRRGCSASPTSPSPATCCPTTSTAPSRCCGPSSSSSPRSSTGRSSSCSRARSRSGSRSAPTAATRCACRSRCRRASPPPSLVVLAARGPIENAFDGSATLYWTFVVGGVAYAASYFARGYLAGHRWFGLYGGLVLFEAVGAVLLPGRGRRRAGERETAVALGIAAAPILSLLVVPAALARHVAPDRRRRPTRPRRADAAGGRGFAVAVGAIQLAEQTLINAAVLRHGPPPARCWPASCSTRCSSVARRCSSSRPCRPRCSPTCRG